MKKKLVFIGLVFLFLFTVPFMFQDFNSILINNPKLATDPNFEAISESEYATRWILSNTSAFEDFHDDIASGYWDLYDVSERYMMIDYSDFSNYLSNNYTFGSGWDYTGTAHNLQTRDMTARGIFWDGSYWYYLGDYNNYVYKYYPNWTYTGDSYNLNGQCNEPRDIAWDGTYWYVVAHDNYKVYKYNSDWSYTDTSYNVYPIDDNPTSIWWVDPYWYVVGWTKDKVYKRNSDFSTTGVSYYIGGQEGAPTSICWDGANWWMIGLQHDTAYKYNSTWGYTGESYNLNSEDANPWDIFQKGNVWWMVGDIHDAVYKYHIYNISKNYYGSGYAYMQTDTTETVGLISPTYGSTYNLSSGDYFKINCKPMTSNKIELKLYNNGMIQKTITVVPQGNTNYNTRDICVSVDEYVEFDQLLFIGTLEDTDYFKVFDVKTDKYDSIVNTIWVAPNDKESIYLYPDSYILKIYEQDALKVEKNITLTADDLYTEIYSPIGIIECRLSLFSQENNPLDFNLFHINITRTFNNDTDTYPLLSDIFIADIETNVGFEIWDIFDNLIKNETVAAKSFIDIMIDIYSLKISHRAIAESLITIQTAGSDYIIMEPLTPEELVEYQLTVNDYIVNWTNGENDELTIYNISLSSDFLLILETTYYQVYFSLFNYNNERLDTSLFSFYLNNTRKDFGFVRLESEYYNIKVLDSLNVSVFNQIIYLKNFQEYNIIINAFELQIRHLGLETSKVNITEITTGNSIEFLIPTDTLRTFSLADSTYYVVWTNGENGQETSYTIVPSSDYLLTLESAYYQVYFSIFNYDGLGIMPETIRFYINNERKDLGFNTLKQDTNNLKVLDFFNAILYNQDVNLRGYTEYNIAVEIYELIVMNNYTHSIIITIKRNDSASMVKQVIPSQASISYRFLTNITYKIKCYDINETFIEEKTVLLNKDPTLVAFGWYSIEVPAEPEPDLETAPMDWMITVIFILVAGIIILGILVYYYWDKFDQCKYNYRILRGSKR